MNLNELPDSLSLSMQAPIGAKRIYENSDFSAFTEIVSLKGCFAIVELKPASQ